MTGWQAKVISHARGTAYEGSLPTDCCGNCYSFKGKGEAFTENYCNDTVSAFPLEYVEPNWWCVRFSRRSDELMSPEWRAKYGGEALKAGEAK